MNSKNGGAKYPWSYWFDRKRRFTIKPGIDFHCQTHGMAQQIRNMASKLGHRVRLKVHEDGSITVENK